MATYPLSLSWTDRVDGVDYVYAADPNSIIAEVIAIAQDLVGSGGTVGGLSQGGGSFYARWTNQHNTDGTHKAITATTISASGAITAPNATNTINGLIINSGALSGITTISASGNTSIGGIAYVGSGTGSGAVTINSNQIGINGNADFYVNNFSSGNGNVIMGKSGGGTVTAMNSLVATAGFGCNSKTAQTAYASGGAVTTTELVNGIAQTIGATAGTQMGNLATLVANIRLALVANGIMS